MATGNRAMPTLRLTNARPQNLDVWGTTPELGDIVSSSPVSLSLARYGPQHRGSQHPTFFNIEIEPSLSDFENRTVACSVLLQQGTSHHAFCQREKAISELKDSALRPTASRDATSVMATRHRAHLCRPVVFFTVPQCWGVDLRQHVDYFRCPGWGAGASWKGTTAAARAGM
jgi:hypothetical protein